MPWLRILLLVCLSVPIAHRSARADDEKPAEKPANGAVSTVTGETASEASSEAEQKFQRAWFDIEDPKKRAGVAIVLRELLETDGLDASLVVRAHLGMARLEKYRGEPAAARLRLEGLVKLTENDASLRRMVVEQLGRPRWFHAIRIIQPGFATYLDLDTGGLTRHRDRHPRGGPEMNLSTILVPHELDAEFGAAAPPMSLKPWHRLRTDEGNLAWVQVLSTSPQVVVRFITRVGGYGSTLPAPRSPFCIGYNSKIEVWWHTNERYTKYRVERRVGSDGAWQDAGHFTDPPFIDRKVAPNRRYGYRIFGVTKDEIEGLPVRLQGTTRSRGVMSGKVEIRPQTGVDFLLGDTVPMNKGDIKVLNIWSQGAMIRSYIGANLFPSNAIDGVAEPRSPWDATLTGNWQLKTGDVFFAPLRGGGVVRCEITVQTVAKNRKWSATLRYQAYGDSDVFPEPPTIVAEQTEDGVRITGTAPEPFRLAQATVRELFSGKGPWLIELDENGVGYDRRKGGNDIREYSTVAMDAHGRRTLAGRTLLVQMADEPVHGSFEIHYQQGFSIERKKVVALAVKGEADLFFEAASAGIGQIYFYAPHGIMNLSSAVDWNSLKATEEQIYNRLASVDPAKFALTTGYMWSKQKNKGESVLVIRTRHGGWVKLWIASRPTKGAWRRRKIKVKYVYNPRSPTFDKEPGEITERNGLRFSDLAQIEEYARIIGEWTGGWNSLRRNRAFVKEMGVLAAMGGVVADADDVQEVLLEQHASKASATARYSFELARRDPPKAASAEISWDIRWKGNDFEARLANEDHSHLTDLGRLHWLRIERQQQLAPRKGRNARVRYGHVYLHRKIVGKKRGAVTLFRVSGLEPGNRLQIEWVRLDAGNLTVSPGLGLDAATRGRLKILLAGVPKDDAETAKMLGGAEAWATFKKLRTREIPSIGKRKVKLSVLIPELSLVSGVPFVLEGDAAGMPVSVLFTKGPLADLLYDLTDATNLEWRIDSGGRVRLRPYRLTKAEEREVAAAEQHRKLEAERERKRKEAKKRKERLAELNEVREALKRAIKDLE